MLERIHKIRLLYVVLAVLLLVGLLPLSVAGILLSRRTAEELRAIEGRYQAQLVRLAHYAVRRHSKMRVEPAASLPSAHVPT